jgi:hypothetical protein
MDTLSYIKESPYIEEVQYAVYTISKIEGNDNIDAIESDVIERGLFIGGISNPILNQKVTSINDLAYAYYREMIVGNLFELPTKDFVNMFKMIYEQALKKI